MALMNFCGGLAVKAVEGRVILKHALLPVLAANSG